MDPYRRPDDCQLERIFADFGTGGIAKRRTLENNLSRFRLLQDRDIFKHHRPTSKSLDAFAAAADDHRPLHTIRLQYERRGTRQAIARTRHSRCEHRSGGDSSIWTEHRQISHPANLSTLNAK